MNTWSNIEILSHDSEITKIDDLEKSLGHLPVQVKQIRELITRFEVCHFKYDRHFKNIKTSISNLQPTIEPSHIGENHIKKGEDAWKNDTTGRSRVGQHYLWAFYNWFGDDVRDSDSDNHSEELDTHVIEWLGEKTPDKERLIRLLIARLTWDWKSYDELQEGGEQEQLEYQICRMDICHYAFPKNINNLLQSIGRMKPAENFEGCGTYDGYIKTYLSTEFIKLCDWLKINNPAKHISKDKDELTKYWLFACLSKTLKEQLGLIEKIPLDLHTEK